MGNENNNSNTENVAKDGIFSGLAAGLGGGVLGFGANLFGNYLMSQNEQKNYALNQKRNFEMSQQAQRNAIPNAVAGLKAAGLNPAAAAGGGAFGAAQAPAAPLQNKAVNAPNFPLSESILALTNARKTNELLDAQKNNINADTSNKLQGVKTGESQVNLNEAQGEKLRAETQNELYRYHVQRDIDGSIFDNLMTHEHEKMANYFKSLGLDIDNPEDVKTAKGNFTSGSLQGENDFFKMSADVIEHMNRENIAREFNENPDLAEAVAQMPYYERQKLITDTAHVKVMAEKEMALRDKLVADTALSQQQRKNLQKEIQKIDADIGEVKARTDRVTSEKFRNYAIGASAITDSAWNIVETFLPKGFLKKAAKEASGSAPMREKTTTTYKETKSGWRHEVNKERFPMTD